MNPCPHGNLIPDTCVVCRRAANPEIEIDDAMIVQGVEPLPEQEQTTPVEVFPGAAALAEEAKNKGRVEALGAMVDCLIESGFSMREAVEGATCAAAKMGIAVRKVE